MLLLLFYKGEKWGEITFKVSIHAISICIMPYWADVHTIFLSCYISQEAEITPIILTMIIYRLISQKIENGKGKKGTLKYQK